MAAHALPAAPPVQRPRVLVVGTAFASAAAIMTFVGLIGIYLTQRASIIGAGDTWIPKGSTIPLQQPTTMLFTLLMSAVTMQWAVHAIANNDRVGLILFSDRIEKVVPPRKGKCHVLRLITDILTTKPKGRGTNLSEGLTYLSHVAKRKTVTFLISDFLATDYEKGLRIVGRKHDLVPVVVNDPFEDKFPALGVVDLEDTETGERMTVDTSDPRIRGRFARFMQGKRDERNKLFKRLQLDSVELRAHEVYGLALQKFFAARAARMGA